MKHILLVAVLALTLAACVQAGDILTVHTADPNVSISFKLLPAPPPLPTVTPQVVPCVGVKANIGRDGRKLYHLPDSPNYNQIVIDESAGEKVFCTEQDAIDAGWTKAGN